MPCGGLRHAVANLVAGRGAIVELEKGLLALWLQHCLLSSGGGRGGNGWCHSNGEENVGRRVDLQRRRERRLF